MDRLPVRQHGYTRRRVLTEGVAVLTSLSTLSLLTACGNTTTSTVTTPSYSTASSTKVPGTSSSTARTTLANTATSPKGAAGQVTWLVPEDPLLDKFATKGIVPAFEKTHPALRVQVITPGSTAYGEKLLALVAAGTTPEVFATWSGSSFLELWGHKLLTDLMPYFQRAKVNTDYILPEYLKEYSVHGHLYGVPWLSNPNFLVYNKNLFQQYHVPLPPSDWKDRSWTTDKLLETAQALTHHTTNPATATYGLIMGAGTCGSLGWLWNADPFNDTGGPEDSAVYQGKPLTAVYPDRPGMVDAMTWLADLTLKHHVSPTPTVASALSSQGNPIFSGRVGIVEVAAGWLERQAAVAKPHFQWAIAPFPWGPGKKHTSQREDSAWYLGRGSKNPDGGFELILYATRGAGADAMIQFAENNPPLTNPVYLKKWAAGIARIPGFSMTEEEFISVFEGGIKAGFGDPINIIDHALEYSNAFDQLMAPVWIGKQTPLAGLQAVKQKWEGIIHA